MIFNPTFARSGGGGGSVETVRVVTSASGINTSIIYTDSTMTSQQATSDPFTAATSVDEDMPTGTILVTTGASANNVEHLTLVGSYGTARYGVAYVYKVTG